MIIEFLDILKIFLTTGIGSLLGWFFARSKYKAEVQTIQVSNEGLEIDNLKKIIDIQQTMIDNLNNRVKELEAHLTHIQA